MFYTVTEHQEILEWYASNQDLNILVCMTHGEQAVRSEQKTRE